MQRTERYKMQTVATLHVGMLDYEVNVFGLTVEIPTQAMEPPKIITLKDLGSDEKFLARITRHVQSISTGARVVAVLMMEITRLEPKTIRVTLDIIVEE
ncbi:MAG: hypothetical protein AAB444_02175 [Patescibacteria group bacterium]